MLDGGLTKMENENVKAVILEALSNEEMLASYSDGYGGESY